MAFILAIDDDADRYDGLRRYLDSRPDVTVHVVACVACVTELLPRAGRAQSAALHAAPVFLVVDPGAHPAGEAATPHLQGEAVTFTRSVCGCHPSAGSVGCSWWRFVATLPPDDPVRIDTETGAEHLAWRDHRWNRESCRCDCHDEDDL